MATMPAAHTIRRRRVVLAVLLALSACGNDSAGDRGINIALPEQRVRASISALAGCPSPLDRLRIAHPPLTVRETADALTITIPGARGSAPNLLRFDLDVDEDRSDKAVSVTWAFEFGGDQAELDLGEGRLLNPAKLGTELDAAVRQYLNYDYELGASPHDANRFAEARAKACRSFGRLADSVAVVTNPALRAEVARQKRRDALGWLIMDDYVLKTDSPEGADWEAERDYNPGADPYDY